MFNILSTKNELLTLINSAENKSIAKAVVGHQISVYRWHFWPFLGESNSSLYIVCHAAAATFHQRKKVQKCHVIVSVS